MSPTSENSVNQGLRVRLAASMAEIARLRELLATADRLRVTDAHNLADLLELSQAEAKEGRIGLLASAVALALSQAETQEGKAHLLASMIANNTMRLANALLTAGDAARRESEERFRRLVEASPNGMVMVNADGLIEMVNAQTERLFGYTRAELVGAPLELLLPTRFRAQHPGLRQNFFAAPVARPMGLGRALFGVRKDGSEVEVEIGLSPIETDDGTMVLSTIVDISHRVRMEAQLRQSQKMHAIGRVAAGVAHDFNNLLMVVSGSLELLLDVVAGQPEACEVGNMALRATMRGKDLTDRLLSFSRQQHLKAAPVRVDDLFGHLNRLRAHLFETNTKGRSELVMAPVAPGLSLFADAAQLEAALINLAVNARDAMPTGGRLRFSAYATDADPLIVSPGRYTVISVADTGTGMDAATLAQACDPFFSTKGPDGTGLGLSMAQGFARQSGGEAHITSQVGEGTTIELWLPSVVAPTLHATPMAPRDPACVGEVLLVDDSQDGLVVVAAFLRSAGMTVTACSSGDLALAELQGGRRFDAIVTDFAMPGMNGRELLRLAAELRPTMPSMIMTGFSDPEFLSEVNDIVVLQKPFNRAELIKVVKDLIAANRVPARQ